MKEKEIYEQFLRVSGISEKEVIDYRYCTKFYAGTYIQNAITIQLRNGKTIIYEAFDIDTITKELNEAIGTVEERRAAVEKQKSKKSIESDEKYGTFRCASCGRLILTKDRFKTHKYCLLCSQKLDWSDEE